LGRTLEYKWYLDDFPYIAMTNLWLGLGERGFAGQPIYVVQTDSRVIERCMLMCTDPGDLVVDPTCGSGTTAYVAEQWGRRWITIDTSRVALALARQRLMGARYPYYLIADSTAGRAKELELTGKPAPSDPVGDDIRLGFVYERVPHIKLESIANNPDIREGMSLDQIDAAVRRHAESELLCNKPYEDKATVRVSGPFTMESLTPHRSLTFGDADENSERETISEYHAATDPEGPTFEQTVLDNLVKAGVQIGRRAERIEFASLDPHAGTYLNAIGTPVSAEDTDGSARRVGIAIGPQYGTVDPPYIKHAVREAIAVGDIDLLCVMAFSFDAQTADVTEVDGVDFRSVSQGFAQVEEERTVGRFRLLKVRMNHDLLMGEELKKTGAGNLFTVFGEPDIDLRVTSDGFEVEIKGIDVYDPTTGEVRSGGTDKLALWMIDTDYNDEAFFVRHCYFTGGLDPYKKLKTALKADIDADAWESLTRTTSRPFARPDTGNIAVKVINDYGDEVMKVYSL